MSWPLASSLIVVAAVAAGLGWYERSRPSAKVLALVAVLAALASLGRVAFAPLPSVKPTSDIVLISGLALGGAPGFAVGALAALTSNLFFGQGPWTPWQMVAWGGVGLAGALLGRATRRRPGRFLLAGVCALAGLAFGAVMNLFTFTYLGTHTPGAYALVAGQALPFDLAHAGGNLVFALVFGPALTRALARFRDRLEVSWREIPPPSGAPVIGGPTGPVVTVPPRRAPGAPGAVAAVAVALSLAQAGALAVASPARAATPASYLRAAQNADGGFGAAPGTRSTQLYSGWAALGLAAAGQNPLDVRRPGRRSVIDYMRAGASSLGDTGALERSILVLGAAGVSPRSFGGRDLVAALDGRRTAAGSFSNQVNLTAFGIMALRAAGRSTASLRASTTWLAARHNPDGGFNFAGPGGASGVDDTAAALQGLAAGGAGRSAVAARAGAFLAARQNRDGGFPLVPGQGSNAQSTAFAIQGLVAAGRSPDALHRAGAPSPLAYLRSLTSPSGAVRYSRTSTQTPVWVTGQALAALAHRPLPLRRVARRARAATAQAAAAARASAARASAAHRAHRKGHGGGAVATAGPRGRLLAAAAVAGLATGWVMEPLT